MTDTTDTRDDGGHSQALAQLASIKEMVAALERARAIEEDAHDWEEDATERGLVLVDTTDEDGDPAQVWRKPDATEGGHDTAEEACRAIAPDDYPDEDEARQRIEEDALSVEVRSGWYSPGASDDDRAPEEFCILLCTGGPAVRIVGKLGMHGEPERAWIEYQDWFTPWRTLVPTPGESDGDALLTYARVFYFGEG